MDRLRAAAFLAAGFLSGAAVAAALLLPFAHRRVSLRAVANEFRVAVEAAAVGARDANAPIAFWGDSLTEAKDATPGHDFPHLIAFLYGRRVSNNGVGGETSRQIMERMLSRAASGSPESVVIWAGRNDDLEDPSATLENIRRMVESLPAGSRVLVLGILNGDMKRERRGGDRYAAILRVNDALGLRYGARFVPIREILVAEGTRDDGEAADGDVVPASFRTDALHLNDRGQAAVACAVERAMEANGW